MKTIEQEKLPQEETPLERWKRMYRNGEITMGWLIRYLNGIAGNDPRLLFNVADILRLVRDSKR